MSNDPLGYDALTPSIENEAKAIMSNDSLGYGALAPSIEDEAEAIVSNDFLGHGASAPYIRERLKPSRPKSKNQITVRLLHTLRD